MLSLLKLVHSAQEELVEWRNSPESTKCPASFYNGCERLLNEACQCTEISQLSAVIKVLGHLKVDSGPWDARFLPSLNDIGVALEKYERHLRRRQGPS